MADTEQNDENIELVENTEQKEKDSQENITLNASEVEFFIYAADVTI